MSHSTEQLSAHDSQTLQTDNTTFCQTHGFEEKSIAQDSSQVQHYTNRAVSTAVAAHRFPSRRTTTIVNTQCLSEGIYLLDLEDSYIAQHVKPGQFINLYTHNPLYLLPRPFGVARICGDVVTVIYAVIGEGTAEFSTLRAGDSIDVLGPLGKGFVIGDYSHYVLVGGGLGIPPLIYAAQYIHAIRSFGSETMNITALLGYRNTRYADDIMQPYVDSLQSISNEQGTVLDLCEHLSLNTNQSTVILTCGPDVMMKAVNHWAVEHHIPCQMSLEERMGCGYGTCVACAVDTREGRVKVCTEGPVFNSSQLDWN